MRTIRSRLPRWARILIDWGLTIGVAIAIVLVFQAEIARPYRIPSASMEPTLHCARPDPGCLAGHSDRVLAAPIVYRFRSPERGDVVVFSAPAAAARDCQEGGTYVKRIVGLPGDMVSERDGFVFVDGRRLDEPYVKPGDRDSLAQRWPRVPEGSYFVMGDNRANSCDSRTFGPVPRSRLKGPVVATYWPLDRLGIR